MDTGAVLTPPTEFDIIRRIVDAEQSTLSVEAAQALLRLQFSPEDEQRMNDLAEENRQGRLAAAEEQELESFIRAGQLMGILQSKSRQILESQTLKDEDKA